MIRPERTVTYVERAPPIVSDYHQIWAVSDGRAGNARQADALAAALEQVNHERVDAEGSKEVEA